jgi:hypothetical protein
LTEKQRQGAVIVTFPLIFPLAFTPIEYYYWCDDRRDYPTCYPLELRFSGSLNRDCFASAWAAALDRHPLLRALVDDSHSRPVWIEGNGQLSAFDWAEEGVPISGSTGQIDLTTKPGIQCWLRIGSASSRVLLRFHHACCDGQGAFQFVEDLLIHYHREVHGNEKGIAVRPLQPDRLSRRAIFTQVAERPSFWLKIRYAIAILRFWAPMLVRQSAPLARSADYSGAETEVTDTGFVTQVLDKNTVKSLRQKAISRGVTLNDLLLHELFVILGKWQTNNGGRATDRLSVNVPVSLRGAGDRVLPAANRMSYTFLTRRLRDCRDGAWLLQSIHEEMTKSTRSALRFMGGLAVAGGFQGMTEWFLNRKRAYATIVLSNMGRVLNVKQLPRRQRRIVCGDALLEQVSGVPPIRPLTHAAIAVAAYANEVSVNLQFDSKYFARAQASELLETYVARLKQTANDESWGKSH